MRKINQIILHCSMTDNPEHDNVETIRKWHKKRGWKDIGYHFYIDRRGDIYPGRPVSEVGAHCKHHNQDSIGICLGGKDNFTMNQMFTLLAKLQRLCKEYKLTSWDIFPHKKYDGGNCPTYDVDMVKRAIRRNE